MRTVAGSLDQGNPHRQNRPGAGYWPLGSATPSEPLLVVLPPMCPMSSTKVAAVVIRVCGARFRPPIIRRRRITAREPTERPTTTTPRFNHHIGPGNFYGVNISSSRRQGNRRHRSCHRARNHNSSKSTHGAVPSGDSKRCSATEHATSGGHSLAVSLLLPSTPGMMKTIAPVRPRSAARTMGQRSGKIGTFRICGTPE